MTTSILCVCLSFAIRIPRGVSTATAREIASRMSASGYVIRFPPRTSSYKCWDALVILPGDCGNSSHFYTTRASARNQSSATGRTGTRAREPLAQLKHGGFDGLLEIQRLVGHRQRSRTVALPERREVVAKRQRYLMEELQALGHLPRNEAWRKAWRETFDYNFWQTRRRVGRLIDLVTQNPA